MTSSQREFLSGETSLVSSDDSSFEEYLEIYWESYIENLDNASYGASKNGSVGDVSKSMQRWLQDFPLDIESSSFGVEDLISGSHVPAMIDYIFGQDDIRLYDALSTDGSKMTIGSMAGV